MDWAKAQARGAQLGHARRRLTLAKVLAALLNGFSKSWSGALGPGLRQAAGDLVNREGLTPDDLLAGHYACTAARCAQYPYVLVPHDSTAVNYTRLKATRGLGKLGDSSGGRGLWVHSALALSPDGVPLGVLAFDAWVRPRVTTDYRTRPLRQRESYKWLRTGHAVSARLAPGQHALLLSDRESDTFDYLALPLPANIARLVRAVRPRGCTALVDGWRGSVLQAAAREPVLATRTVSVAATAKRPAREATLEVRWAQVLLESPRRWKAADRCTLPVTVLQVTEPAPPAGVKPLSWTLLTTLEPSSAAEALVLVDAYCARWRIEQVHQALKREGLDIERLQLKTAGALSRALAIYWMVTQRAMELCYEARTNPERPAGELLGDDELAVLSLLRGERIATLGAAVHQLAKLGGWPGYPSSKPYGPKSVEAGLMVLGAMVAYHRALGRPGQRNNDTL